MGQILNWAGCDKSLVDIGATHTFIHLEVAYRLNLPITPCADLSVIVANGDRVCSLGVYAATDNIVIHDEHFSVDCFATVDLGIFDLILGIHWAHRLGFQCPFSGLLVQRSVPPLDWHGHSRQAVRAVVDPCAILQELLLFSMDIIEETHGLPPAYCHDHRIQLLLGSPPVAVRSYHSCRCSRTRSSVNAMTCWSRGSSGSRRRHSPSWCSWSPSMMTVGASASTNVSSTTTPSRTTSPFHWWTSWR